MKYLRFLNYLIRHKWHVFIECCRLGIPWLGITHDISKLLPGEFIPYANYYDKNQAHGSINPAETGETAHQLGWLKHQKRNRHHWQWWILYGEDSSPQVLPMPDKYIKEMVADWRGAGLAQGQSDTLAWYHINKNKIVLHPSTRDKVEQLLRYHTIIIHEERESTQGATCLLDI